MSDSNLVLLHPCLRARYVDAPLISYYTEWLPALLAEVKPRMSLKSVQPVEWPAGEGTVAAVLTWLRLKRPAVGRGQARRRDVHRADTDGRRARAPRHPAAGLVGHHGRRPGRVLPDREAHRRPRRRGSWPGSSREVPETQRKCWRRSMPFCRMRGASHDRGRNELDAVSRRRQHAGRTAAGNARRTWPVSRGPEARHRREHGDRGRTAAARHRRAGNGQDDAGVVDCVGARPGVGARVPHAQRQPGARRAVRLRLSAALLSRADPRRARRAARVVHPLAGARRSHPVPRAARRAHRRDRQGAARFPERSARRARSHGVHACPSSG